MPCRIYKLDFQERQASDLEIRGSNPGSGSNFSLENLIYKVIKKVTLNVDVKTPIR